MFTRRIYQELQKHLKNKQITVITGMRQTGKTTVVKQLLDDIPSDNKLYIDLERLDQRELFYEKNYDNILYTLQQRGLNIEQPMIVALDEIQYVKNLPSVLKYLYDHYPIKFIVTGSSSYYIKNLFTESLAGRKKIFEMHQLDFGEFLTFKQLPYQATTHFWKTKFHPAEYERLKNYYAEYLTYGGFPAVVLEKTAQNKQDLLADILTSYVTIDIKSLADFRDDHTVYTVIKLLAARVGTRLDYAKLARLVDLSQVTVQNYVDFFEKTYLISRVPVFTRNTDKAIVKAQKLYFCDNGLLNNLAEVSSGAKFENAVFNQLKHFGKLSYYALKSGKEIDFVLDQHIAFEVKETPTNQDQYALEKLARSIHVPEQHIIGYHPTPHFQEFIWSGNII